MDKITFKENGYKNERFFDYLGFGLIVMSNFIVSAVFSFLFNDIKELDLLKYKSLIFCLWVILTTTPILLMLKVYSYEYSKNYQHPFFAQKSKAIKTAIFMAIFMIFCLFWFNKI